MRRRTLVLVFTLALGAAISVADAAAESLESLLPYVVENHDRTRAAKARVTAARNRAREALGGWFPVFGQTANIGHERQNNFSSADTSTGFAEYDLKLTQLLWDFGATNAAVEKARLDVTEAKLNLIAERQALIQEAVSAYVNVRRAHAALTFARQSESNIRQQTGLEEALVGLGSGFSTDVLQAKTQLAGAQARRNAAEGQLTNALNRYRAIFGTVPANLEGMNAVPFPASDLPKGLDEAIDIALEDNPSLKVAHVQIAKGRQDVRTARAEEFAPSVEASAERKFKDNVGGTLGTEQETLAKVEMTWDFNLGLTAVNTLRAAKGDLSASEFSAADTRRTTEEQVRNAWDQLETAKRSAAFLQNQARIAAAFLELARQERQLGRRSLIDVLSGETALINAQSDAASAIADVTVAAYGVLQATGQLNYDVLARAQGIAPPIPDVSMPEAAPPSAPGGIAPAPEGAPAAPVDPAPLPGLDVPPAQTPGDGAGLQDSGASSVAALSSSMPSPLPPDPTASATPLPPHDGNARTLESLASYYVAARQREEAPPVAEGTAPRLAEPLPAPAQPTGEALDALGATAFAPLPSAKVVARFETAAGNPHAERAPAAIEQAAFTDPTKAAPTTDRPRSDAEKDFLGNLVDRLQRAADAYKADRRKAALAAPEAAALPPADPEPVPEQAAAPAEEQGGGFFDGLVSRLEAAAAAYEADREKKAAPEEWGGTTAAPLPPEPATRRPELPSDDPVSALFRLIADAGTADDPMVAIHEAETAPDVRHMPEAEPEFAPEPEPTVADDLPSDDPISAFVRILQDGADAYEAARRGDEADRAPDVRHMPEAEPAFAPEPEPTVADDLPSDDPISALLYALDELLGGHGRPQPAMPMSELPDEQASREGPPAQTAAADDDFLSQMFRERFDIAYQPGDPSQREIN